MKLIEKCKELYSLHSGGGNLHIVLDDENIANHHIIFCLNESVKEKDWLCVEICNELLQMSYKDRLKLVRKYSEYSS